MQRSFLSPDITIRVMETEYTAYYDMLKMAHPKYKLVASNVANRFRPANEAFYSGSE